ncbi:UNVERIFIED_CONTAM: hypothetical protein Sradi_5848000 [Sesamum radiatum]|uniref:DUF4283 domain-containing protein n=1 Tax=Sesamum radiatum TaxID=300843 RepID=A0AAW2KR63_SESRA
MEDESDDDELVDGGHGNISAALAMVPTAGGVSKMVEESDDGDLEEGGHGDFSTAPAKTPTAESDSTMEKLRAEFNIKEFFEHASRVIDKEDSKSMEVLMNLKNKWKKKLGGEFASAGNGGLRPVHSRQPTPFPAPTLCPARRFLRRQTAEQAVLIRAAPTSCSVEPHSSSAAPHSGSAAPTSAALEFRGANLVFRDAALGFLGADLVFCEAALEFRGAALGFRSANLVFCEAALGFRGADLVFCGAALKFRSATLGFRSADLEFHNAALVFRGAALGFHGADLVFCGTAIFDSSSTARHWNGCPFLESCYAGILFPFNRCSAGFLSPFDRCSAGAAVLNGSASLNLVPSPSPLAVLWVPTMGPRPPSAMDVGGIGSLTQLLSSPISGYPPAGITPATLPEYSLFPPRVWAAPPQQPAAMADPHSQQSVLWAPPPQLPSIGSAPATTPPEMLIGNIPLKPCSDLFIYEDKIATAFHNSSRKTLTYILPSVQNGEVLVRPTIGMIRAGSKRWNTTAVGYFLGKKPYFHHLNEFVRSIWPGVRDVKATSNGFFFFQFETVAAMQDVIEGGPWLYLGQPIVLQKWEPGMVLRKLKYIEVPVWIKLRHLSVELWTTEGLSTVASGIGRPLYPDAITRECTRLDFARVCIMLNVSSKLPKHVVIMMPNELGGESACKVDVEYEWLPPKCTGCSSLGHSTKECPLSKPTKPKVAIYVRKPLPPTPAAPDLKLSEQGHTDLAPEETHPETETDRVGEEMSEYGKDKSNDIVLFNAIRHFLTKRTISLDLSLPYSDISSPTLSVSVSGWVSSGARSVWPCSLNFKSGAAGVGGRGFLIYIATAGFVWFGKRAFLRIMTKT